MFKAKPGDGGQERSTKQRGDLAEARALAHLQAHGLLLVQRNYRVALGPNAHGGEIDLILRERDGTLV
ncbi:MAG: YraN family protein, partial [Rubrivivax sp.]